MNKSDLIVQTAAKCNLSLDDATKVVDLIFNGFAKELAHGGHIEIRGFASFSVKNYGSYTGRNPKSGKTVTVKPKRLAVFRAGRPLRKRINNGKPTTAESSHRTNHRTGSKAISGYAAKIPKKPNAVLSAE